jgi:hypothetical protein
LSFSVITDDLTSSSKDQNNFLHCKLQRRLWSFKTCLQTNFSENKHIIRKSKYWSWGETFWFRYFDRWRYVIFATCAWVGWISM